MNSIRIRSTVTLIPVLAATMTFQASASDAFEDGASCLFAGHSFFVPVAVSFNELAEQNDFPEHAMETVFRSGAMGSPIGLWNDADAKAQIEAALATGEIEVFGLTTYADSPNLADDFRLWFDLALTYNPEIEFFIGQSWGGGGPQLPTEEFDESINTSAAYLLEVVTALRTDYPDNRINVVVYGKTASIMKGLFEADALPDITELVGVGPQALFVDGVIGHAGPMLTELSALTWMDTLYGAEVTTVTFTEWQSDVVSIVEDVMAFNAVFEIDDEPTSPTGDLTGDGVVDAADLAAVLAAWGVCAGCLEDLDGDGVVGAGDLAVVLASWTK